MIVTQYPDAGSFLQQAQAWLERDEVVNSLMLGICSFLQRRPESKEPPYLAIAADGQAPALAAVMTPPYNLVLYAGGDQPGGALDALARDLHAKGIALPGVLAPAHTARAFAEKWSALTRLPQHIGREQRIFKLERVIPPRLAPGRLREAGAADLELMVRWIRAFMGEALPGGPADDALEVAARHVEDRNLFVWDDAGPVSMAARTRATPHGRTVSLVYTPPALRGRGYASSCVAALSQLLLDSGYAFCALFTDLSNPTSNHIYQEIGYAPVCDFTEYRFDRGRGSADE